MKRIFFLAAMAAHLAASSAMAANVGVSVSIGQPGFYGRIDVGGYPAPRVLYPQPLIIERAPAYGQPLYLRVPPGHAKRWSRYCDRYQACGEPVYFVRDDWYRREYVPRYRESHRDHDAYDGDRGRHDHGHHHGHDRD